MISKVINKNILVYDFGSFFGIAERLTKYYNKVYYHTPSINFGYPRHAAFYIGENIEGVIRVEDWESILPFVDAIIFPDVYQYSKHSFLRNYGKPVYGCGDSGKLEIDRI